MTNLLDKTDSYKATHHLFYPEGMTAMYSFLESRGGKYPQTTQFGFQYVMREHLTKMVTTHQVEYAQERFAAHFGTDAYFNYKGWMHIVEKHEGRIPVIIKAVPEGTTIPTGNVLLTVESTDPEVSWIANYIEGLLLQTWYPTTVCTQSREMKKVIRRYLEYSGTPEDIDFKLHDFGFRGSTSVESAMLGGAAHLVNFKGTDTLVALDMVSRYYADDKYMAGFSIGAAEHSTITSWGRTHEAEAYKAMLDRAPDGLLAIVSDSYDIYKACNEIFGKELKDQIMGRNGTVVCRPDSGDPTKILPDLLYILGSKFGYETNEKGYKVLDPHVRLIQGDGVDADTLEDFCEAVTSNGWSLDNLAFGSGGGLLQKVNRDTQKFAIKCSSVEVNGQWRDVIKDPVTDPGKKSKAGKLALVMGPRGIETVPLENAPHNLLRTVFENGVITEQDSFEKIRQRASLNP